MRCDAEVSLARPEPRSRVGDASVTHPGAGSPLRRPLRPAARGTRSRPDNKVPPPGRRLFTPSSSFFRSSLRSTTISAALSKLTSIIRSSLVLGFVGAGGIGFQLLTAMNLFQYREVSLLLIVIFVIVFAAERLSAICRQRLA